VVAAIAVLLPALVHGLSLGPFDQLSRYGLSTRPGTVVHYTGPGDQIEMLIPWTTLAWTQVHHGHLPLWNPYSGLGMPLVFNWQSASFSVPALLGYLVPVHLAFTVAEVATLLIAGSGVYVLGRVLRMGVLGAAMAATVVRAQRSFHGLVGMAQRGGDVLGGMALRHRHPHRAGPPPGARHRLVRRLPGLCRVRRATRDGGPLGMGLAVFLVVFVALRRRRSPSAAPSCGPSWTSFWPRRRGRRSLHPWRWPASNWPRSRWSGW